MIKRLCSVAGCGKKHFCKSFCRAHYERMNRHGDPLTCHKPISAKGKPMAWILTNVGHDGDGCLIWPFARFPDGRAHMASGKPSRIMCEQAHGPAPTQTHEAAHSCGNAYGGCVHPKHLRWATALENAADKRLHGTIIEGEAHYASKLTAANVREIRRLALTMPQKDLCPLFGVNANTISKIVNLKAWKHVQ